MAGNVVSRCWKAMATTVRASSADTAQLAASTTDRATANGE